MVAMIGRLGNKDYPGGWAKISRLSKADSWPLQCSKAPLRDNIWQDVYEYCPLRRTCGSVRWRRTNGAGGQFRLVLNPALGAEGISSSAGGRVGQWPREAFPQFLFSRVHHRVLRDLSPFEQQGCSAQAFP